MACVWADVVNYSSVCAGFGLLQHVCVLSWSITARGCAIKLLYTTV